MEPIPKLPRVSGDEVAKIRAAMATLEFAVETIVAMKVRGEHVDPAVERKLLGQVEQLRQHLIDTELLLGNQVLETALAGYAALKAAGKSTPELDALHRGIFDA